MERERLRSLLDKQAQDCMELSDKLRNVGREPLTMEENKLARIATLLAIQEAFEVGLTSYLVFGEASRMIEGIGESVHES